MREACMAQNLLLTFNGVSPASGVLSKNPRGFFEVDNTSCDAGSLPPGAAGAAEVATQLRAIGKAAALQTISETRLALSLRTSPQMVKLDEATPPGTAVDLYRNPINKDVHGWRGPATVLELNKEEDTAIVKW